MAGKPSPIWKTRPSRAVHALLALGIAALVGVPVLVLLPIGEVPPPPPQSFSVVIERAEPPAQALPPLTVPPLWSERVDQPVPAPQPAAPDPLNVPFGADDPEIIEPEVVPRTALAPTDAQMLESGENGQLPRPRTDGAQPWQVYARPFDANNPRARIAIIIDDVGFSENATLAAIQDLPVAVTLAFSPYARRLAYWVEQARTAGHEVLVAVPMEPVSFPRDDPGPRALLIGNDDETNLANLRWALSRLTGYVGVINAMGGRFTADERRFFPVLEEVKDRGLLFVDSRETLLSAAPAIAREIRLPFAGVTRRIDENAARASIDDRLEVLVQTALSEGVAIGIGSSFPTTFERINRWAETLEGRGAVLAPVSAVVAAQWQG